MKKKILIIAAALLALAVLAAAGIALWQRDNISAAVNAAQYSSEEINAQIEENQQRVQDAIDAVPGLTVRDLTEDEKQSLKEGTLTGEELIEKLTEKTAEEPGAADGPQDATGVDGASEETLSAEEIAYQQSLSELLARVYIMRQEYANALEEMAGNAASEYSAMPKSERTKAKLSKWVMSYAREATALEKECDGRMDVVVKEMTELITEGGGDLSLVDEIVTSYAKEKSLKKAWYLSEIEKKGLLR